MDRKVTLLSFVEMMLEFNREEKQYFSFHTKLIDSMIGPPRVSF